MRIRCMWSQYRPIAVAVVVTAIVVLFTLSLQLRSINQEPTLFISDDGFITDCITKAVIGRVPHNMMAIPLEAQETVVTETREQRNASFHNVFSAKLWGDKFDVNYKGIAASGPGSTLHYSQEAMAGLHSIINDFKRKNGVSRVRILDIPCGDMAWMSRFLMTRDDIDYTGMDIVSDLIANHKMTFKKFSWKFVNQDIVDKPLNQSYDIIFCRMMLQHLHTIDVLKVLKRFSESGSRLLLTTSFYMTKLNRELPNLKGRFRLLNLEISPISLIPPLCIFRDGLPKDYRDIHFLALWNLPLKRIKQCQTQNTTSFTPLGWNGHFFSCTNWSLSV